MFLKAFHSRRGQGLLEVIIGIGVIMAGTVGTITLISSTVQAGRTVSQKIVAASLAREGIEVIRNARDSNWLRIQANEDMDNDPTNGIQLPKSFEGIFNESTPWHNVVPEFGVSSNTWVVSPVSNPPADPFNANCGSKKCSQIFLDSTNGGYFQDVSPSGTESESRFRRLVIVNPICRRDNDADGVPDVGAATGLPSEAKEELVLTDDSTCVAPFMLVGLQVISRVTWDGETNCPSAKCFELEDRLYNWKYVK